MIHARKPTNSVELKTTLLTTWTDLSQGFPDEAIVSFSDRSFRNRLQSYIAEADEDFEYYLST